MSNAVRQRRKSQRRKAGLIVLDVEVHENAFAEALINSGRLTPARLLLVRFGAEGQDVTLKDASAGVQGRFGIIDRHAFSKYSTAVGRSLAFTER